MVINYTLLLSCSLSVFALTTACGVEGKGKIMHCLIDLIDDWTFNMHNIRQSQAELNCTLYKEMEKCQHKGGDGCDISALVQESQAITEILTFRKDSSSFLHGFLALGPVCAQEGQAIVGEYSSCMRKFHEPSMMLSVVDFLYDQVEDGIENRAGGNEEWCSSLTEQVKEMGTSAAEHCSEAVGRLMCESVKYAFEQVHPDIIKSCDNVDDLCPKQPPPQAEQQNGLNAEPQVAGGGSAWIKSTMLSLLLAYTLIV